jgi:hypothetical protein
MASPIPEEAVELVAKRRWERDQSAGPFAPLGPTWEELRHKPGGPERREKYLVPARRDLEAAAPALLKQGAEEERERLKEEIKRLDAKAKDLYEKHSAGADVVQGEVNALRRAVEFLDNQEAS